MLYTYTLVKHIVIFTVFYSLCVRAWWYGANMAVHICLSSWSSLEIHMNEDGRAAGKEQEEIHWYNSNLKCDTGQQRTFYLTWIHSEEKHVEQNSSKK